jgi:hypothetical protein
MNVRNHVIAEVTLKAVRILTILDHTFSKEIRLKERDFGESQIHDCC